ncbi:hypothetical protein ACNKHQ_22605 [Shigella flexneri]
MTPNLETYYTLPVQGLHVDLVHGKDGAQPPASAPAS